MREGQGPLGHARRQIAQVADLLPRQPRRAQRVVGGREHVLGARALPGIDLAEPSMNRARRLARELLEHDRAHQSIVVRSGPPRLEPARPDAIDDRGEDGVDLP